MMINTKKCTTEFKKDFGFGGTGGGRLRSACADCKYYNRRFGRCHHPVSEGFSVPKEIAIYKGCKKGWTAK